MAKEHRFSINEKEFVFTNSASGVEEISYNGVAVSSIRSMFGATHEFSIEGDNYCVKVKQTLGGFTFACKVNGKNVAMPVEEDKLPTSAWFYCGWPLILVGFGGAIGGGLGGLAAGININIYRSNMPLAAKFVLNIVCGSLAFILWYTIATMINS